MKGNDNLLRRNSSSALICLKIRINYETKTIIFYSSSLCFCRHFGSSANPLRGRKKNSMGAKGLSGRATKKRTCFAASLSQYLILLLNNLLNETFYNLQKHLRNLKFLNLDFKKIVWLKLISEMFDM